MPPLQAPGRTTSSGTHYLAVLRRLAAADPLQPAVTCDGDTVRRAELLDGIHALSAELAQLGVAPADTVAVLLPNSVEFVQAVFAVYTLGAVPLPIPVNLTGHERQMLLDLAQPRAVVGTAAAEANDVPALDRKAVRTVVARGARGHEPVPILSPASRICASGGSTGRPKLIRLIGEPLAEVVLLVAASLRIPDDAAVLTPVPFSHSGPFSTMLAALLTGNHLVTMEQFDAEQTLRLIEQHGAGHLYLTPSLMQRIGRLPESVRTGAGISSLRTVFHVGAPCPVWLKRSWIDWIGPEKILESYGSTEATAATLIDGRDWPNRPGSVGRAVVGQIEARDSEGRVVRPRLKANCGCVRSPAPRLLTSTSEQIR